MRQRKKELGLKRKKMPMYPLLRIRQLMLDVFHPDLLLTDNFVEFYLHTNIDSESCVLFDRWKHVKHTRKPRRYY